MERTLSLHAVSKNYYQAFKRQSRGDGSAGWQDADSGRIGLLFKLMKQASPEDLL